MQKTKRKKPNSYTIRTALEWFDEGKHFEGLSVIATEHIPIPEDLRERLISSLTNYIIEKIINVTLVDYTVDDLSMAYVASMRLAGLVYLNVDTLSSRKDFHVYRVALKTIRHCMTIYRNCHLFLANNPIPIKRILSLAQLSELKTLALANYRLGWMSNRTFFNVVILKIIKQYLRRTVAHYEVGLQATIHFLKPILNAMHRENITNDRYILDTDVVFRLPNNRDHIVSALWETVKNK